MNENEDHELSARAVYRRSLRRLRAQRGWALSELSSRTNYDASYLQRLEKGARLGTLEAAQTLDGVYDSGDLHADLWRLSKREAGGRHFGGFAEAEAAATGIHEFSVGAVPGLLQTPGYAETLMRMERPASEEILAQQVQARMARQERLTGAGAVYYRGLLDESVIRRPVRDPQVWADQLERLVQAAPQPIMWDSGASQAAGSVATVKTLEAAPGDAAAGDEDASEGPVDSSQVAPLQVAVDADDSQLTLTPDQSMLTGADTSFPLYIDPLTYTPKAGDWTMVSKYWASSPQYHFNGDSDAGVGDCDWNYCAPSDVKELFYAFPTSKFAGKTILSATFVGHETHAASCTATAVQLWRAKGFTSQTTWNSSRDNWLDRLDTKTVAYGNDGCAASDVEFNATTGMKYAAAHSYGTTTFGLKAEDETDKYGWKRFSDDAYLRVHYNTPPKQLSMSQLTMSPGGTCHGPSSPARINKVPILTAHNVTDPDGDEVSVQFHLGWDAGDGKGFVTHWTSAKIGPKKSGSTFSTSLSGEDGPTIPENTTIGWSARVVDYDQGTYYSYSPWSYSGSATDCYWVYDTSVPDGPKITSGDYPAVNDADPDDPSYDGVGRDGTFTFDAPDTDVVKYCWTLNGDPVCDPTRTLTTTGGAPRTATFRPTRPGTNFVSAQAFDSAGNVSEKEMYTFRVKEGQPARAQWLMDDDPGATQAAGTAGDRPLSLVGTPALGVPGKVGTAVQFDGTDSYLESDIPAVRTDSSFSVGAWVKLDRMPTTAAIVAAEPGNHSPGFELYYSHGYDRWVFNQYQSDTASALPVRAMSSTAGGVVANQWYHLLGSYNGVDHNLRLYVDGQLVGTTPYTTAWDARRGLQIGAGSYDGSPASFFPGTIDDVRIYDKALKDADVTRLAAGQPIAAGRPAQAVFPLDEPATQDNGLATTEVHGQADVEPAVFHGGVTAGDAGAEDTALTFDGTSGYASTLSSHVNNQHSYSVVAWAKLEEKPDHAGIVATQTGAHKPGFELYYSATYGWSFDAFTEDSDDADIVRAAQGDTTRSPAGEWTQLLGSYDANTDDMRLYVNGQLAKDTKFAAPFYGGGPTQIGAGSYDGVPGSFFPGQIDKVQLYDRALSGPEAEEMYNNQLLVEGRWAMDTASGSPLVSPDSLPTEADRHPLTLGSGAQIDASGWNNRVGTGGLVLDGTADSYASTSVSPIHTDKSFTISAWVLLTDVPTVPVTVMSMAGENTSSLAVQYDPATSSWQLRVASSDSSSPVQSVVSNTNVKQGDWNHLAVVYDLPANTISLYANGEIVPSDCVDDGDTGSDGPDCTVPWATDAAPFDATMGLQLGRDKTGASTWGHYMSGDVDDVWVFSGAASDAQIMSLGSGEDLDTTAGP